LLLITRFTNEAIVMHSKPKAIPQDVVERYPNVTRDEILSLIGTLRPP